MHVDDAIRKAREKRSRQQVHVAREDDQLDAVLLEPAGHDEIAFLPRRVTVQRERRARDLRGARAVQRRRVLAVRSDGEDRQPGIDQRLQVRPFARDEDSDHSFSILPMTSSSPGSATTAQNPIPRLKTRRSSSSSTCCASQWKTGGRSQASQSILARTPTGTTRATFPAMPPPVTCAKACAPVRSLRTSSR